MQEEQLKTEISRCLGCKVKPCHKACPLGVSPMDFILAAKQNDFMAAAQQIALKNPLPQTCGLICPDRFCQKVCIRSRMDGAVSIPCLQAEMMKRGGYPPLELPEAIGKKAAIIGGGPAGLGAAYEFLLAGWHVAIYEAKDVLGGAARLIPEYRLAHKVLDTEIKRIVDNERVEVFLNTMVEDFAALKDKYDSVILALGETEPRQLGIIGEQYCVPYTSYLRHPEQFKGMKICVSGGGEVALDCALTAKKNGATDVEMFVRRRRSDMRIMARDQEELAQEGIMVHELSSVTQIADANGHFSLQVVSNRINDAGKAEACAGTEKQLMGYDLIIQALGAYYPKDKIPQDSIIAGDMTGVCGTVVQALASGQAAAQKVIEETK